MSKAARLLVVLVAALTAAAGVALALSASEDVGAAGRAREFQGLVGGLGFGPAVDPGRCGVSFDPRLCPACSADAGPIPAGRCFCPRHGCSVFEYRPPETGR